MMFSELSKVMDHAIHDNRYIDSLKENIASKQTKSNQKRTDSALINLFKFDEDYVPFKCFKHFWQIVDENELPTITLLYAVCHDYLLKESANVILETPVGEKVSKPRLEANIELYHPQKFTKNTISSATRNLISSWKQAGYISYNKLGIRIQQNHSYQIVAFAFLMAYVNGDRGDFILKSKWVKILALSELQIRELAAEAAKRDLLQYQFAGNVSVISFNNLFERLNIDA
ncbi:MAG: hypothetical protein KDC90_13065 [Ignavibacteriae bacterium]|nr:hypothetical protein [Ignavibacteriota bacterium]